MAPASRPVPRVRPRRRFADLAEALAWADAHVNLEAHHGPHPPPPTLERMRRLVGLMGDPQHAYPVVHVTGTNGKGSTAQMLTALFMAKGLRVGTYTSPHLSSVNERVSVDAVAVDDEDLLDALAALAELEALMDAPPTWFEIMTAAAFRHFADVAVDVAVVEVGVGGRLDATNVADGTVAVLTNVSFDHVEMLGPTLFDIAREKSGIVKPGSVFVVGETDEGLVGVARSAGAARVLERERDFGCRANRTALGGRLLDLFTPRGSYPEVFVPLHGAHQGDNAAVALAAAEAFFEAALDPEVVASGFGAVRWPGRLEVVGRRPLVLLDGAHNVAGASATARALAEDFARPARRVLVVGMLRGRDPAAVLGALGVGAGDELVACTPSSPRALPAAVVAAAGASLGAHCEVADAPLRALERALALAGEDDMVLVTGSLYVVGAVRPELVARREAAGSGAAPRTGSSTPQSR